MAKDDKTPKIILSDQVKDALAEVMRGMSEAFLNALQGVKDGRYKSFEDAVEAMTGSRPTLVSDAEASELGLEEGIEFESITLESLRKEQDDDD